MVISELTPSGYKRWLSIWFTVPPFPLVTASKPKQTREPTASSEERILCLLPHHLLQVTLWLKLFDNEQKTTLLFKGNSYVLTLFVSVSQITALMSHDKCTNPLSKRKNNYSTSSFILSPFHKCKCFEKKNCFTKILFFIGLSNAYLSLKEQIVKFKKFWIEVLVYSNRKLFSIPNSK